MLLLGRTKAGRLYWCDQDGWDADSKGRTPTDAIRVTAFGDVWWLGMLVYAEMIWIYIYI